jgi:hypothetical protein
VDLQLAVADDTGVEFGGQIDETADRAH